METPTTSKTMYEAASLRHEQAGAALALARAELAHAKAALEYAEEEWMDSAALLRTHESAPGIPAYLAAAPAAPERSTYDRAAGHG